MLKPVDNDSVVMPKPVFTKNDNTAHSKINNENSIRNIRSRKLTPRVMPTLTNNKMSGSIEVIQEQEVEEVETENNDEKIKGELECKDGTFQLPKLNKVEIVAKVVPKTQGIKIDLRHHNFENEPLTTSEECATKVKLGKILYDDSQKTKTLAKKKLLRKISKGSETLALVIEEVPKVDLDVLCACAWLFSLENLQRKTIRISVVLIGFLHKDDEVNKSQNVFKDQISELF